MSKPKTWIIRTILPLGIEAFELILEEKRSYSKNHNVQTHNSNGASKPRSSEDVPPASFPRRASEPVHRRKSVDTTASDGKRMSQAKIDKFQLSELHDASRGRIYFKFKNSLFLSKN